MLSPDRVRAALRGSFGSEYHYALETATTQQRLGRLNLTGRAEPPIGCTVCGVA